MATISEAVKIADEGAWLDRVEYCRLGAAIAIMAEDPQTANHAERVAYANRIIAGGDNVSGYALGVATDATVLSQLTTVNDAPEYGVGDASVQNVVNGLFNAFAGIST